MTVTSLSLSIYRRKKGTSLSLSIYHRQKEINELVHKSLIPVYMEPTEYVIQIDVVGKSNGKLFILAIDPQIISRFASKLSNVACSGQLQHDPYRQRI